jgi:hypothetical protein
MLFYSTDQNVLFNKYDREIKFDREQESIDMPRPPLHASQLQAQHNTTMLKCKNQVT